MERRGNAHGLTSSLRWVLVVASAVLVLYHICAATAGLIRWDYGDGGYTQHWPDLVIRAVRPGYPAERAGLRAGDTIELSRLSFHDRLTVIGYRSALRGEVVNLTVLRDGVDRTFAVRLQPTEKNPRLVGIAVLNLLTAVLIAALVIFVLMRSPTIEAMALWGFAVAFFQPNNGEVGYLCGDWVDALWSGCITDIFAGFFMTGMIVFALRATGRWPHRARYELAAVVLGVAAFAISQYADAIMLLFGTVPSRLVSTIASQSFTVPYVADAIIVAVAFLRARGPSRIRLRWVTIGFACLTAGWGWFEIFSNIPALAFVVWPDFVLLAIFNAGFGTLGFAIVRRDLFDVGFVVNRAAIYTTLTALLVGAFAALNWSIGVLLKQTGLALPVDVILAAAVGLSLNVIQRRVDRNVDRVFFRRRYDAEQRLRRIARALAHVTDNDAIAHALVVEPVDALGLHAAAFYRESANGPYDLIAARGWPPGSPTAVAATDPLVLHLSGVTEALRLESVPHDAAFPHGPARPRIAFPMWSRRELVGFVLYSTHLNGAMLDPDEVELIERIAAASVVALERVAAISLHDRFVSLKADFESIKAQRDEFLAILAGGAQPAPRAIGSEAS
jgi:hypothetical protein